MTLSEELQWRGFVNQTTLSDVKILDEKKKKFYLGFDASAPSQTVGNLAAMMFAKCFLRHGWEGVLLAGGSTSLIGDPGGKDAERPLQAEETVAANVEQAAAQITKILQGHDFKLVNNLDWTKDMSVIHFLRDVGKHFSMTPLIQRDYIAKRLGEGGVGISYAEFSYTILQGMDYLHLYDTEGVTLQLGGSDQWGNCLSGVELIRRARGAEVDVMTLNLVINKATGKKFGKTEDGAVWLDPAQTSVYQFYQFWLNADDEGVEDYLKTYTEMSKEEVDELLTRSRANPEQRLAQQTLAFKVTELVHGHDRAVSVQNVSKAVFGGDFTDVQEKELEELTSEVPVVQAAEGHELVHLLVQAKLAASNTEARRFLNEKAIYINNVQIAAGKATLEDSDFRGKYCLLRRGKNRLALVER